MSIKVFGLSDSRALATRVAQRLKLMRYPEADALDFYSAQVFSDGEIETSFTESIRGDDVFLIQSLLTSDGILELLLAIDAAKHASAKSVVAVIPYFGYGRQDRKSKPRVSVGAKLLAKILECSGATRVITIDLHASQEQCFFDIPVDHISAESLFIEHIKHSGIPNLILAAPDAGAAKRIEKAAKILNCPMVMCHKHREKANEVASMMLIGDVSNKNVVLWDDMIDTGGTICKAAELLRENGALTVTVVTTHAVFSGSAIDRLNNCTAIENVIYTDTVRTIDGAKFTCISCATLLANVISAVYNNKPISQYL